MTVGGTYSIHPSLQIQLLKRATRFGTATVQSDNEQVRDDVGAQPDDWTIYTIRVEKYEAAVVVQRLTDFFCRIASRLNGNATLLKTTFDVADTQLCVVQNSGRTVAANGDDNDDNDDYEQIDEQFFDPEFSIAANTGRQVWEVCCVASSSRRRQAFFLLQSSWRFIEALRIKPDFFGNLLCHKRVLELGAGANKRRARFC